MICLFERYVRPSPRSNPPYPHTPNRPTQPRATTGQYAYRLDALQPPAAQMGTYGSHNGWVWGFPTTSQYAGIRKAFGGAELALQLYFNL